MIEYQELPSFESTGALVDLSPYGANAVKDQFAPWTWHQVTLGNAIEAIPGDIAPMGLYYRQDIFQKYHLPVPTTWAQYADDVAKLHAADPNEYITDFPPGNQGSSLDWCGRQVGNCSRSMANPGKSPSITPRPYRSPPTGKI
jgi:multiple sugar transport system substrate-binding protein